MKDSNMEDGHGHQRDHKDASAAKHDDHDMRRMGKTPELSRVFRQVSIMSLTCVIMATWEYLFTANSRGLLDGGPGGMIWSYIWTITGFALMVASLAELSSMFAPANFQKPLSYATGWLSIVSYQAGNASGFFLVGTIIQSLATTNHPEYHSTSWQSTLCVLAAVLISGVCNVFLSELLPIITNISMVIHIMAFFATTVVIWTFAPHPPAQAVILDIINSGGWPNLTVSMLVGQVCAIASLGCSDSASHMSEEVLDAGVSVPRAMIWSLAINGAMGLIFVFTFAFSIPSVNEALNDPSGYAFIWVFRTALSADSAAGNILTTAVVFVLMSGNLAYTAVSARQIWSFARDEGLPCSAWLCKTGGGHAVPVNATLVTLGCTVLLSLINLVSKAALNAILSLQLSAMLATYAVCLACVSTAKCFRPGTVPQARWSLGRYGLPINILATLYATFACFWTFWPDHAEVRVGSMNWAPVILVGVMLIASGLYFARIRNVYHGPVTLVNR